ncbi:MAG: winged helix-turn-helix domain-containing protein [Bacteroidaceae bacterium]|nr:winged helix-turn-helix domain-containing protein [Bacteroidaceae bacterium]
MKKQTLYYILLFVVIYSLGSIVEYNNSRRDIENNINELFKVSSQSFNDSITNIKDIYLYYTYDSEDLNKRRDMRFVDKDGEITISRDLINIENPQEYKKKQLQSIMLNDSEDYDLYVADSIWNKQLRASGYDVEAILLLSAKKLKDMFPRRDSLDLSKKVPFMSVHHLGGKEYFVTDSVGLGICNQGCIVSHVHIPMLTVIKNVKWWGTALWMAISAILLLFSISAFRKYRKERKNNMHYQEIADSITPEDDKFNIHIEHLVYNTNDGTLYDTINNQQLKLPRTQAQMMKMLVTSTDYCVSKNEICQAIWSLDENAATRSYNSLCKRLRDSLESFDGVELVTIKDTAIQLVVTSSSK